MKMISMWAACLRSLISRDGSYLSYILREDNDIIANKAIKINGLKFKLINQIKGMHLVNQEQIW